VLCEISDNEKDYKISVHYIFKNMKAELIEEVIILIVEIKRYDLKLLYTSVNMFPTTKGVENVLLIAINSTPSTWSRLC
jgi:cobalamin biosynthesis Co2+ chelatase CbiK